MDETLERSSAINSEISMPMNYEFTGKSRLVPAYLRGCIYNMITGSRLDIHKARQSNQRLALTAHQQPGTVIRSTNREQ